MLHSIATQAAVLAAGGSGINTQGINDLIIKVIAPILLALIGCGLLAKAHKGQVSKAANVGTVAIIGVLFLGGAGVLIAFGTQLSHTIFTG